MTTLGDVFTQAMPPDLRASIAANPQAQDLLTAMVDAADDVLGPWVLRSQAVQLLTEVGTMLDQADAAEHAAELAAAAAEAESALVAAEQEASRLTQTVRQAVEAERAAADRYTAAQDFARQCGETAEDLAVAQAPPEDQTEAIVRRNVAEGVAGQARARAEAAAGNRVSAEASLATARDVVRKAKAAVKAAQDAAQNPSTPRPSWVTLQLDGVRRVSLNQIDGWSAGDLGIVADAVRNLASATGAEKAIRRDERTQHQQEINERQSALIMPPRGHSLRPTTDPGVIVPPPGSAPIVPRVG